MPNRRASRNDSTGSGSVASPACVADKPAVSCMNSVTMSMPSDTAAYRNTVARLPTAKLRVAKMFSGNIGCGVCRSQNGNASRLARPTARAMSTTGSEIPSRCPSMSA